MIGDSLSYKYRTTDYGITAFCCMVVAHISVLAPRFYNIGQLTNLTQDSAELVDVSD